MSVITRTVRRYDRLQYGDLCLLNNETYRVLRGNNYGARTIAIRKVFKSDGGQLVYDGKAFTVAANLVTPLNNRATFVTDPEQVEIDISGYAPIEIPEDTF